MDSRRIGVVVLVLVAGAIAGWAWRGPSSRAGDGHAIPVSGTIEVDELRLGFKLPGRISRMLVLEGQPVKLGQELARLDDYQLQAQLQQATAAAAVAQANVRLLEAGARPQEIRQAELAADSAGENYRMIQEGARRQEIAQARAALAQAAANWRNARDNLRRSEALLRQQVTTRQQFEAAQTQETVVRKQMQSAQAALDLVVSGARPEQVTIARQQWQSAQQQASLVRSGSRAEQIAGARAQLAQARAGVHLLQTQLADTVVRSPVEGVVITRAAATGEVVAAGSAILTVANLSYVWLRVYVPETQVGLVKHGQMAEVHVDSYPGKTFTGRVAEISQQAEFTPKNVQTKEERVTQVFAVRVHIANPERALKSGLPVDAVILTDTGPSTPGRL